MVKPDNPEMPDFDRLNDRLIAQAPKGPFLGIRTNLDELEAEGAGFRRPKEKDEQKKGG